MYLKLYQKILNKFKYFNIEILIQFNQFIMAFNYLSYSLRYT